MTEQRTLIRVDDGMIDRAARALAEECGDLESYLSNRGGWAREYWDSAKVALAAALGEPEDPDRRYPVGLTFGEIEALRALVGKADHAVANATTEAQ